MDYVDVTNAELWAAYNFVQPSSGLLAQYKQQSIHSPGVVGLSTDGEGRSKVALHPAVAGTALGWNAIHADNVIGYASKKFDPINSAALPAAFRKFPWRGFSYDALQWFDEASVAILDGASVVIRPQESPGQCLLRMRSLIRSSGLDNEAQADELASLIVVELTTGYSNDWVRKAKQ